MGITLAGRWLFEYNAGGSGEKSLYLVTATMGHPAAKSAMGEKVQTKVIDVEELKKKVRKLAASRVLAGERVDVGLDLGQIDRCRVCITAGYGQTGKVPQPVSRDRLIWVLDGYVEVHDSAGKVTHVSQGESLVLARGSACRLVFPQLTLYLSVEATGEG
jgi:uncharacterized cupin superfamily protein